MYGDVNWFDGSARRVRRDGGRRHRRARRAVDAGRSRRISTSAIATDTGGFRYGPISRAHVRALPAHRRDRRRTARALAPDLRQLRRSAACKLTGALLNAMELHHGSRLAVLSFDDELLRRVRRDDRRHRGPRQPAARRAEVVAVALFKRQADGAYRVSLRSKGAVDVRARRRALGRRRPHERRRLHDRRRLRDAQGGDGRRHRRGDRARATLDRAQSLSSPVARWTAFCSSTSPSGPTSHDVVARLRRATRRAQHRPHGHARSARDRPAAARPRPRDAAGVAPDAAATRPTRRRSGSASPPTPTTRTARPLGAARGGAARRRGDRRGARRRFAARSSRLPPRALGEEGRRAQGVRPGAARRSRSTLEPVTVTVAALELHRRARATWCSCA